MRSSNIRNYVPEILLLGSAAILQFYRLGIGEFASWDESLYLVRAEACVRFGAWLDQTKYAIGGLYSSTHPPLVIWLMALTRTIFGDGLFASRAIAAVSAVVAILFCYKLCRLIASREAALVASISLACAQPFVWYGHHAQLDIPMMAGVFVTLYFFTRSVQTNSARDSIIAGIAFGIALSTKAFQALAIVPILAALPFTFQASNKYGLLLRLLGIAAIISLPWYAYMLLQHPDFFLQYGYLVTSLRSGSYSPGKTNKQWWYYANQLLIALPLFSLVAAIFINKSKDKLLIRLFFSMGAWLLFLLIFLSAMHTRMLHFVLHLLPISSVLLAIAVDRYNSLDVKSTKIVLLGLTGLTTTWSVSEALRRVIKLGLSPVYNIDWVVVGVLFFMGCLYFVFLRKAKMSLVSISICIILLGLSYYRLAIETDEEYISGAKSVAESLENVGVSSVAIVYPDYPHEILVPQLAYYTSGWTLEWRAQKSATFLTWKETDSTLSATKTLPAQSAIMYIGWDEFYKPSMEEIAITHRLDSSLMSIYLRKIRANKYTLYY
ncbi:MAG TPA: glycosyltransferase family 39 protein [Candidatus Kapabacteria bacterium]|nr:glycosyltransferase family 39 protein [Candidatus Kapabacteria bacterium]